MSTYYISPTGSDTTGNGTQTYPWKTLTKFYAIPPVPGDILECRGGFDSPYVNPALVYVDGISGTALAPITVRAFAGEIPRFTSTGVNGHVQFRAGSSHHVIDGLTHDSWINLGSTGVFWIGDASTDTGLITFRNGKITASPNWVDGHTHPFYLSGHAIDVAVRDFTMIGSNPGSWADGAGVQAYNATVGPLRTIVDHCIIVGFQWGVIIWGPGATATITHDTFLDCYTNIDLRDHVATLVRDNAGENGSNANIYDPTDSAYTTADHNYWAQTFDANYYLNVGQTGIDAASDGSDAGALDSTPEGAAPSGLPHQAVVIF